jgi:hypothetical protein
MSWFIQRRDRASDRFWAAKIDAVFEFRGEDRILLALKEAL